MASLTEFTNEEVRERVGQLQEMITCGFDVWTWHYDREGNLLETNSPEIVLDKIFAGSDDGCKAYMMERAVHPDVPVILSGKLGIMWGAAYHCLHGELKSIYVLGPVFNTSVSLEGINQALKAASRKYEIPVPWRPFFKDILRHIPVVGSNMFFQYVVMLHWCVTGEKLSRGVLHFQKKPKEQGPEDTGGQNDRHQTYQIEQALLNNVRAGNLNYRSELEQAGMISNGLRITTDTPLSQAIYSEVTFISLCTRAAIEGGMSPDAAYTLGDSYIQSVTRCKTLTEVRNIGHEMYGDFIYRVHTLHADPNLSAAILFCKDYIEMHPTKDLSLATLADRVSYAPYYLSRKFKKETGTSLSDYIRSVRMEHAKFLLSNSGESIADIAEELHFCSSSHFSDTFRKTTGMLPQEYRRQTQKI